MFNVERHLDEYMALLAELDSRAVEQLARVFLGAWRAKRTVFFCGNGGSAMSAGHLATDLTKLTAPARGPRLRAQALTDSLATISAIANDFSYEDVFAEQLKAFLAPEDVLVALSTSGSSPNVLRAVEYANRSGGVTIGITGRHGAALAGLAQHVVVINSLNVQQIEDATMVVGHLACMRTKDLIAHEGLELSYKDKPAMLHVVRAEDRPAV